MGKGWPVLGGIGGYGDAEQKTGGWGAAAGAEFRIGAGWDGGGGGFLLGWAIGEELLLVSVRREDDEGLAATDTS